MARPYIAEVNKHVTYWAANRKPRSATITALNGSGSTTLAAIANAGATTISTVATAAVGQWVTIVDGANTEQRRVSAVAGAGPFTLTVPGIRYDHASGTAVRLEPTSLNLKYKIITGGTWPAFTYGPQAVNTIARQVNESDVNVWSPA